MTIRGTGEEAYDNFAMSVQYNPFDSVTTAFSMPIMNVPGKNITSLLVDYPPGEKAPAHRHGSAFVICYVLSGELRSQMEGEPARIYKKGEHFIEAPGAHHLIAENASQDQNCKVLAVIIHDTSEENVVEYD
ncbi:cupin domain-containing protein [Ditylenchus destructor]|uniref:Cupin domain-containing protein n=1 Tax=Ditylenchus destructor TaxID=166010 RepID=A0AAD4MQA0_9BILA|nr:cupin domain-containing protein [Ditylenchus destructor]